VADKVSSLVEQMIWRVVWSPFQQTKSACYDKGDLSTGETLYASNAMMAEWNLYYRKSMGEADRSVGDVFDWPTLGFWDVTSIKPSATRQRIAVPAANYFYDVIAEVVSVHNRACLIDFGTRAVGDIDWLPPDTHVGDFIAGTIAIDLPVIVPDFAPEHLNGSLRRQWKVTGAIADLSGLINTGTRWVRDESRILFKEVEDTAAIQTHSYILRCEDLDSVSAATFR
jgi:hypothetical protein